MSKKSIVIVIGLLVAVTLAFVGYRMMAGPPAQQAAYGTINAVWAVQGPFKNGEESARAMRYASKALDGPRAFYKAIDTHPAAYDAHPERWEQIRQSYLQLASGPEFEAGLAKAKELGAVVRSTPSTPAR